MLSQPYTSECKNTFNETTYNFIPSAFGLNNVTAVQTEQHSVCDTVSTSIIGNSQQPLPYIPYLNNPTQIPLYYATLYNDESRNPQIIQAHKRLIPGGVTFTFETVYQNAPAQLNPSPPVPYNQDSYYQQQQLVQQQIMLKQIEKEALELMLIQDNLSNAGGKLKFHYHGQTSTTDLTRGQSQKPKLKVTPDFNSLMAVLNDLKRELKEIEAVDFSSNSPCALYSQVSTSKKLMLTKSPDLVEKEQRNKAIVVDTGEQNPSETKKTESNKNSQSKNNVCFKGFQSKSKKRKSRKSKKKETKRKHFRSESCSSSSDSYSSDDSDDEYSN